MTYPKRVLIAIDQLFAAVQMLEQAGLIAAGRAAGRAAEVLA